MTEPPTSRDKILDTAEALFARRGYAGVGLREVAESVGLGKSSLFHHFRSKAQLYFEVHLRVMRLLRERLDAVLRETGRPRVQLERWIGEVIDILAEHPTVPRLLLRSLFEDEDARPPEADAAEKLLASILGDADAILQRGIACGDFRDVSVPHTIQTLIGATVYHFASAEVGEGILGRPLFSAEEVARRKSEVIALLRHGLVAAGTEGAPNPDPAQPRRSSP